MSRIPADQSAAFTCWDMPEIKDGQVINVEKLQQRGPRGELIDVDKNEVIYSAITAAQLEQISNEAYEDIRQQAYQDGLKQGQEEGYKAGVEAGQLLIQQQSTALQEAVAQVFEYLAGEDDEVEKALVSIITSISRSILRRELSLDSSQIRLVISEAMASLPSNSSNITIYLSQQDHQLLTALGDIPAQWQLQIDPALSAGGCRVSNQFSVVDYTLEQQFQQLVDKLVAKRFDQLLMNEASVAAEKTSEASD